MKYTVEISDVINEFKWWGGACDTIKDIREAGLGEEFNRHIEETFMFDEEPPRDVDINDYVWHDRASVYDALGLDEDGKLPDEDTEDEDGDEDEDEDGDPLLLQVDGRAMTEEEAEQLKDAIFCKVDACDLPLDGFEYPHEIPNYYLNATYEGIAFTADDFGCNL